MAEDKEEKKKWKILIQMMTEEEGEEDGMMDGIVGMINNPLVEDGFWGVDRELFDRGDIFGSSYSLKKLHIFLG